MSLLAFRPELAVLSEGQHETVALFFARRASEVQVFRASPCHLVLVLHCAEPERLCDSQDLIARISQDGRDGVWRTELLVGPGRWRLLEREEKLGRVLTTLLLAAAE